MFISLLPQTRWRPRLARSRGWWVLGLAVFAPAASATVTVEVTGLTADLERNVRAYLSIDDPVETVDREPTDGPVPEDEWLAEERRVRRLHAAAAAEIAAGLQPFGYYEPSIDASLTGGRGEWTARYAVDTGPPVLLTVVDVQVTADGHDSTALAAAQKAIALAPGQVLNHPRYQAARESLYDAAHSAGFIDAAYERSELLVNRPQREAEVHLLLDTGPQYFFGEITVEQDVLDPRFVDRFVTVKRGEPFDTNRLVALQIALNDSGYFNDVAIDIAREQAVDHRIPVTVRTTPRLRQEYTLGVGYGTDTGPRLSMGVNLRRIGERGHRFNTDFRVSNIEQTAAAEYRIPTRNVATDFLAFRTSLGHEEIGGWDTLRLSLGAAWQDDWHGLRRHLYATAQREDFSTDLTESRIENVFYAGAQLTAKRADDPLFPRRGHSWSVDLRAGTDAAFDATSFTRLHANTNLVRSFGDRLRVLLRAEYGALRAQEFDRLVPSQRFYAGGDGSVRGYGYQDLGPKDANGANVGGRYAFVASAELEIGIVGNYGAALFVDAGNAANEPAPKLSRGVGIGMRWRSPVGMVGIDIAHPLDDPDTDYRLHLRIGTDL